MRILFMGSPVFALPSFLMLAQHHELIAAVTQPDRPAGRGRAITQSPVKRAALEHSIPLLQPRRINDPAVLPLLRELKPDVIVVAAYGQILSPAILELPPHGCVNVHASLLPRWRGAAPVHAAILHGDAQSGVSIMKMDPGLDTGPIISQRQIPIILDETGGDLSSRLAALGAELLDETLIPYSLGELQPVPQNDNQATHAPLLKKSDGLLDWRKTAIELDRQVRAFEPWPGSFFHWKQRRITVRKAHSQSCESANSARVILTGELPAVGTSAGLLVLDILQPAGRTSMPADTFLRGAPNFINAALHLPD